MTLTPHRAIAVVLSILVLSLAIATTTLTLTAPTHTRAHVELAAHTTATRTTLAVEDGAVPVVVWQGLREAGYQGVAGDGMEAIYVPAGALDKAMHTYGYAHEDVYWPLVHVVKTT